MERLWLVALALMAGCAVPGGGSVPQQTVQVTPARDAAWPQAQGETEVIVRAVTADAAGNETEVPGARCTVSTPYYAAEFDSPARVLVPDFGAASPSITAACRAGDAEGSVLSRPEPRGTGGFYGWPAVGISVGTGNSGGVGVGMGWYGGGTGWTSGNAAIRYPALRVVLN